MRENRPYGSEGGEGHNLSRPLSWKETQGSAARFMPARVDAVGGNFAVNHSFSICGSIPLRHFGCGYAAL